MTKSARSSANNIKSRKRSARKKDRNEFGQDIQERFAPLLLGYNCAHHDLLDATGPNHVRRTHEPGIYEIMIGGEMSMSILTAEVVSDGGADRLEPLDFLTTFYLALYPDFSYAYDRKDSYVIRLMTRWLEKAFLVHEDAILNGIRALPQTEAAAGA